MKNKVVVVDYGSGNLFSLTRALEVAGGEVILSSDPVIILEAPRLVVPGVGAFGKCMGQMRKKGLEEVVRNYAIGGSPMLGICVGMQILFEIGEEFGEHRGLGLIPGRVVQISSHSVDKELLKRPHIAWAPLETVEGCTWEGSVLSDIELQSCMYFAHSYFCVPTTLGHSISEFCYGGHQMCAVVRMENLTGCQFHPEKSGDKGLAILRNFLSQ